MKQKFLIQNSKKANIPITILVLGVFAVCALAVISFKVFDNSTSDLAAEFVEGINQEVEKYNFYLEQKGEKFALNYTDFEKDGGNICFDDNRLWEGKRGFKLKVNYCLDK